MAETSERFRFDLPNSLSRNVEVQADFFKRQRIAVVESETHFKHFLFPRRQRIEHRADLFAKQRVRRLRGGIFDFFVFDEISEQRILFFADRRFKRNRLARDVFHLLDAGNRPAELLRDFIEPLCVSALNTAMHEASGAVFLRVLRDALFGVRGGSNLLLPRVPLGDLWPEPALRWLQERGARLHMGQRVQGLQAESAGWRVHWQAGDEACSALFDAVILATAAPHAAQLAGEAITPPAWPHAPRLQAWRACAAALRHTAITTVYAQAAPEAIAAAFARPMLALRSGPAAPAQFAFALDAMRLRGAEGNAQQAAEPNAEPSAEPNAEPNITGLLAFVISNSAGQERQALCAAVAAQAQSQLGLAVNVLRSVSEKRATFACTPALPRPAAAIAPGLAACGDYVQGPYPATLEGAMRSGWQALDQAQAAFP